MFTGLVQALGQLQRSVDQVTITCKAEDVNTIVTDLAIGDSVAVDGICLTVTTLLPSGFTAITSPETLYRTTLSQSYPQQWVNLEPSLRVGSKLGGHFVTGHVDGVGYLETVLQTATSWEMSFAIDGAIRRYIVPKGSVAVNGISLTIAECSDDGAWFKVAVIPHTYATTNLCYLEVGSMVNLEGDILGKYVEKLLREGANSAIVPPTDQGARYSGITPDFLAEHGYL